MSDTEFAAVLARTADVDGWLTDAQARRLYDRASDLGNGTRIVEIGSFRGKSTIVLASSAGDGVELVAIDPHAGGDRGPQEIVPDRALGDADHAAFIENLTKAGVRDQVRHVRAVSTVAHAALEGDVDLLYVDGAHRYGPARADMSDWGDRVSGGGTMLIHDAFSSIGVTLALLTTTVFGSSWRYLGRTGSLVEYRRERLGQRDRLLNSARQLMQLPWFIRNVIVKVLIMLKLRPLTRVLGHTTDDWPY